MVRRVDTETPACERVPEQAPVRAVVAVRICLDPCVACRSERRVARLQRERVEEEVEEDYIACGAVRVCARVGCMAVLLDERRVDVVQQVRPHLADVVHLVERPDRGVTERVRRRRRRVWVRADAGVVVDHPLTHHEVLRTLVGLVQPAATGGWSACAQSESEREGTHSANASDQPSPIPPASVVWRQRPVPPPVMRLVRPCVFS